MSLLLSNHLSLSPFRSTDKSALVHHLAEKEIYDLTLSIPYPYTEAHAEEWLAIYRAETEKHGQPLHWAIRQDENLIGGIGFSGDDIGKAHRAEVGYWLAKPYWGQGVMTQILPKVCALAFSEWNLVKITAHVFAGNLASARVLEKCGFEQEGYLRKHYLKDGKFVDARAFALFRG